MSSNLPATTDGADIMEAVITRGDLAKLSPQERSEYYGAVCKSIGLNPLTKPFDYLTLSGKLVLYATRTATDQLRRINGVSITSVERDLLDGVLMVTATAQDKSGRVDTEIGAVNVAGLKGDALANAYMKALTKAKRRVTLSICGLGWLDESEVETIPHARAATVDVETGEIVDAPQTRQDRPRRDEAPAEASGDLQTTMRRLHAALAAHSITHQDLHDYYAAKGFASTADVPLDALDRMSVWAKTHDTEAVQGEFARVLASPAQDRLVDALASGPAGEPGNDRYSN